MSIGVRIKRLRERYNLSQPELACRLGISQTTLCNIESGKCKKIDFLLMIKVCKEFDVSVDYFMGKPERNQLAK